MTRRNGLRAALSASLHDATVPVASREVLVIVLGEFDLRLVVMIGDGDSRP